MRYRLEETEVYPVWEVWEVKDWKDTDIELTEGEYLEWVAAREAYGVWQKRFWRAAEGKE